MTSRGEDGFLELPSIVAAAHELKAPLALIRQLSLSLEATEDLSASRAKIANRITLSSERALRLTSDLTRASRMQDSLFELEPVNTVELCQDVADELRPLFVARGVDIRVRRSRRSVLAVANRDLLRRVIANFSDNALEHSGDSGAIELVASVRAGRARIAVRDFGPAIPKKAIKQLKNSLGRSAQPVDSRPSSSGLGLYLAAQFARYMNSQVGTINHRDGTTFYVDLPVSSQLRLL